ncbi:MAG: ABC transporter, partial [Actinobacteria bacterium]
MILFYGGNGMTEASLIFFLLLTTRAIARWLERGALRPLITAAGGLGLAYLTRYEAIAAGAAVTALVAAVSYRRARGARRRQIAIADAAIVAAPMVFAVTAWAVVSWVIVGSPFPEFSSVYGNASYVTLGSSTAASGLAALVRQMVALEPLIVAAVALALWLAIRRRET